MLNGLQSKKVNLQPRQRTLKIVVPAYSQNASFMKKNMGQITTDTYRQSDTMVMILVK